MSHGTNKAITSGACRWVEVPDGVTDWERYVAGIVFCSGKKITRVDTPSLKAIARYANCLMRIFASFRSHPPYVAYGGVPSRIHEWGRQAVPADWIARQLDYYAVVGTGE